MLGASSPVMEWLPGPIFAREAHFAYILFTFRLAMSYVPFGNVTDARDAPGYRGRLRWLDRQRS